MNPHCLTRLFIACLLPFGLNGAVHGPFVSRSLEKLSNPRENNQNHLKALLKVA